MIYIISNSSISFHTPAGLRTVLASHPAFTFVKESLRAGHSAEELLSLVDLKQLMVRWSNGNFSITDDAVFYKNMRLPSFLEEKVLTFFENKLPFMPLLKFFERLEANPSRRAVEELYTFLIHKNIPITDDGYFRAYKGVREDFMDFHTGTFSNLPGNVLEMPRNHVDDNFRNHCSYGFHVGSLVYADGFRGSNGRLLIVEVDPADVVSIPDDCECQKLRTCKYRVISEYTGPLPEHYQAPEQDSDQEWADEDIPF